MYDGRQKMKLDAQLKVVFFLGKKTTLTQASLLIFRHLSYVPPLVQEVLNRFDTPYKNYSKPCLNYDLLYRSVHNVSLSNLCQ